MLAIQRNVHKADETIFCYQLPTLDFVVNLCVQYCRDGTEMLEKSRCAIRHLSAFIKVKRLGRGSVLAVRSKNDASASPFRRPAAVLSVVPGGKTQMSNIEEEEPPDGDIDVIKLCFVMLLECSASM
jgi:hypothetical protein